MSMRLFDRPLAPNPYEGLPPSATFTVVSQDLSNNLPMPKLHTAEGGSISPHLEWSGFPDQTESFFVSCFDPDAPHTIGLLALDGDRHPRLMHISCARSWQFRS